MADDPVGVVLAVALPVRGDVAGVADRQEVQIRGGAQDAPAAPDSDVALNLEGWITVTPLSADMTCAAALAPLAQALDTALPGAPADPRGTARAVPPGAG